MSEFKGTKGEWIIRKKKCNYPLENSEFITISKKEGDVIGKNIAKVFATHKAENEANAKLVAAAPDLLEALQELVFVCSHPEDLGLAGIDAMANAQSAIKKALGDDK